MSPKLYDYKLYFYIPKLSTEYILLFLLLFSYLNHILTCYCIFNLKVYLIVIFNIYTILYTKNKIFK